MTCLLKHLSHLACWLALILCFPLIGHAGELPEISLISMQIEDSDIAPGFFNVKVELEHPACFQNTGQTLVPLGEKRLTQAFDNEQLGLERADAYLDGSIGLANLGAKSSNCNMKRSHYTLGPVNLIESLDVWKPNVLIKVRLYVFIGNPKPSYEFLQFFTWPMPLDATTWDNIRAKQILDRNEKFHPLGCHMVLSGELYCTDRGEGVRYPPGAYLVDSIEPLLEQ